MVNEPQAALLGVHFKGFNFKSRYIVEVKQGQKEEGKIGQAPGMIWTMISWLQGVHSAVVLQSLALES